MIHSLFLLFLVGFSSSGAPVSLLRQYCFSSISCPRRTIPHERAASRGPWVSPSRVLLPRVVKPGGVRPRQCPRCSQPISSGGQVRRPCRRSEWNRTRKCTGQGRLSQATPLLAHAAQRRLSLRLASSLPGGRAELELEPSGTWLQSPRAGALPRMATRGPIRSSSPPRRGARRRSPRSSEATRGSPARRTASRWTAARTTARHHSCWLAGRATRPSSALCSM